MSKKLIAYKNFWIDCYTSIINTLIVSIGDEYEYLTYNNNYFYEVPEYPTASDFIFYDPRIVMNHHKTKDTLLLNESHFEFEKTEDLLKELINALEQGKICMTQVDLYYLIENSGNYKRNHIIHSAIVSRVDFEKQIFYIFETGNTGYEEFEMSLINLYQAINAAGNKMDTYDQGVELEHLKYSLSDIITNSFEIEKSIDYILNHEHMIWNLNDSPDAIIPYFFDNCITHLNSLRYRQKANRLLAETLGLTQEKDFAELEERYEILKGRVRKYYNQNKLREFVNHLKKEYIDVLTYEKNIWCDIQKLVN